MERTITYQNQSQKREAKSKNSFFREIRKNHLLYLLTLPGILLIFVFAYLPIFGIAIAFQDYNPVKGVFGSAFVGFKNFRFLIGSSEIVKVLFNTVFLNLLFILCGTIVSVSFAIMFSELNSKKFKTITQTMVTLPNFLSWTVVAMIVSVYFTYQGGVLNQILNAIGFESIIFFNEPGYWPLFLVCIKIWHGAGFGSIVYLATISGINPEIYESASMDGASRWKKICYITLPMLKPTIILLLLLALGGIFYGDFGMIYAIVGKNALLYPTTDVIDTYVYRALVDLGNVSMSAAVGVFQSFIGFMLVVTVNQITRKYSPESALY
ncbi:ABC transporter permease subunit [Paenibacillus sp. sptzw28]|uniref:ABC transporter permease n=1 Tax=Paenibacillus sp. sptzw28 TaxID=715179 RepID=UPI001C6DED43|nr:ABC transporter permease subunit [Paenibacillus sp. sptzw28]QYR22763.1 ABC transporter permease subunit [Paenibacillus sp. sptzw28]